MQTSCWNEIEHALSCSEQFQGVLNSPIIHHFIHHPSFHCKLEKHSRGSSVGWEKLSLMHSYSFTAASIEPKRWQYYCLSPEGLVGGKWFIVLSGQIIIPWRQCAIVSQDGQESCFMAVNIKKKECKSLCEAQEANNHLLSQPGSFLTRSTSWSSQHVTHVTSDHRLYLQTFSSLC